MKKPRVGIIMGSDSDLAVMREAAKTLESFGVAFEISVVSAHRSPKQVQTYARTAAGRGLKVIIAGAGGAAHLAGAVAAQTTLPIIGVPIASGPLKGYDALLSTVQMPSGVPVACVGINAAKNAGLLAAQILALADAELSKKLSAYKTELSAAVKAKAEKLQKLGYKKYLEGQK